MSAASSALARRCRHSPWTGITLRGLHDVVAVEQLAGAGVAGDVHHGVALVHDVGAPAGQAVDHAVDRVLVARDQRRREDDGVALADAGCGGRGWPSGTAPPSARPASPVEISTTSSSGRSSSVLDVDEHARRAPAGSRGRGRSPMLRTIERPTKATLRPCRAAASSTCWTRCTWEAKQATMIRCWRSAKTWSSTGRDVALGRW